MEDKEWTLDVIIEELNTLKASFMDDNYGCYPVVLDKAIDAIEEYQGFFDAVWEKYHLRNGE